MYNTYSKNLIIPIVPINLPAITIITSAKKSCHDQSNWAYEKKVSPKYPKTKASIAYPITLKAKEVTYFAYGERLYQEYFDIKIPEAKRAIIPEKWNNSATQYERYPKQNINVHSTTGFTVRNLKNFVTIALIKANAIPVNIDQKLNLKKLYKIKNGVVLLNSLVGPANSITVLNRIMHTASFVIPSPNTKLNNFGYSSYLMIEIAATTSVQHSREHINKISIIDNSNCSY